MDASAEQAQLVVSVGGSKCAFAVVGLSSHAILARSPRIDWTGEGLTTIDAFVRMLVRECRQLLATAGISADRIVCAGVAWPGPETNGHFEATFIPGCQTPQPIVRIFQEALAATFGSRFESVPVRVLLDAVARASGEATPGGSLYPTAPHDLSTGILINIATGIAGAITRHGRALLTYPGIGKNYGQFGRFLFLNTATDVWEWRPTRDGSVPPHSPQEIRWTRHCAGPALARRIARWCDDHGGGSSQRDAIVADALRHFQSTPDRRDAARELTLLRWCTEEARRDPAGPLGGFVAHIARDIGAALCTLVPAFALDRVGVIVLAGGVGENFGRADVQDNDAFLQIIQLAAAPIAARICRARLGVDAEFLGLAVTSFAGAR